LEAFAAAREQARGVDRNWEEWWLDIGSLADALAEAEDAELRATAAPLQEALVASVPYAWSRPPLGFASGATVFADSSRGPWLDRYRQGPWAENGWAELLDQLHDAGW
jgi:hypothetical protein